MGFKLLCLEDCSVFPYKLTLHHEVTSYDIALTANSKEVKGNSRLCCGTSPWPYSPLCWWANVSRCVHSIAGSICSTETAASHWRTTPVLCGSCKPGPERGDSLVLRVTPGGQELQNFLCTHGTQLFISDVCLLLRISWHLWFAF